MLFMCTATCTFCSNLCPSVVLHKHQIRQNWTLSLGRNKLLRFLRKIRMPMLGACDAKSRCCRPRQRHQATDAPVNARHASCSNTHLDWLWVWHWSSHSASAAFSTIHLLSHNFLPQYVPAHLSLSLLLSPLHFLNALVSRLRVVGARTVARIAHWARSQRSAYCAYFS